SAVQSTVSCERTTPSLSTTSQMPTPTVSTSSPSPTRAAAAASSGSVVAAVGSRSSRCRLPSPRTAPTAILVPPTSTPRATGSANGEVCRSDSEQQPNGRVGHVEEPVRHALRNEQAVAGLHLEPELSGTVVDTFREEQVQPALDDVAGEVAAVAAGAGPLAGEQLDEAA